MQGEKFLARRLESLDPLFHVTAPFRKNRIGMLPGLRDPMKTGECAVSLTGRIVGAAGQFEEVGPCHVGIGAIERPSQCRFCQSGSVEWPFELQQHLASSVLVRE